MAISTFCDTDRRCEIQEEMFTEFKGTCDNSAEPHSTLCEQHGGVAEFESFLEEWEFHIFHEEDLCEHITEDEDPVKLTAFINGNLPNQTKGLRNG